MSSLLIDTIPKDSDFSLRNLPFGVFSTKHQPRRRCCTRVGDTLLDLSILHEAGLLIYTSGLDQATLNVFLEQPRKVWLQVRSQLIDLLTNEASAFNTNVALREAVLQHMDETVTLHLPITVGDYTDFYSSREHATNVGTMFRGKDNALQPNWLHLPVGYHGRSSTVVVSGTPVCRPCGQLQKDKDDPSLGSVYGSCQLLDFELEMAAVVGGPANCLGQPLTLEQAKDRIFGFMLMNDWSARDIQKWEYVPLGPFTAKNFATTVSPWIVMAEALDVVPATAQTDPVPLEYLRDSEPAAYNVELTVAIQSKDQSEAHVVCHSNFTNMYWNAAQQLVHHSVSGCVMRAGDLLGSGTISGSTEDSYGSMLELSWKGSKEVKVGEEFRKFLKDDDTVMMRGLCVKDGMGRVGFGECDGQIRPAITTEGDVTPTQPILLEDRFIDFKLYGYWRSSSTWRVRVLLAAKDVQYTTVPVNLLKGENRTEEFLAKNPLGQIPLLECTDTATGETVCLAQSVAIMEFLEGIFPTRRSLMPSDPVDKGVALEMAEAINAGTQPLQNIFFLRKLEEISDGKINASEMAKEANERGLRVLESLVKRRHEKVKGPFCLGTFSPSFVDACMVPQIYNARRFGVDVLEVCPRLAEIEALCSKHAWFKASHPNVQPDAVVE